MKISHLISYFNRFLPLTDEEISFLQENFKERKVKRKEFILESGEICKFNTFIVKGCFRTYCVDEEGKEHNVMFATENWWIGDIISFRTGEPTCFNIKAIENSIILQIKKDKQKELFKKYPKFHLIFRELAENAFVSQQRRILQMITYTAEQRYLDFLQKQPDLFNRVSNVQIASYLGITPEFLSTIRKRITNSK